MHKGDFPAGFSRHTFVGAILRAFTVSYLPAGTVIIRHCTSILNICFTECFQELADRSIRATVINREPPYSEVLPVAHF